MPTFARVIPLLVYRDIQAAHDFLVEAFGFEAGGVERAADGQDSEPTDQPYGHREYGARDPEGHRWWFAAPLSAPAAR